MAGAPASLWLVSRSACEQKDSYRIMIRDDGNWVFIIHNDNFACDGSFVCYSSFIRDGNFGCFGDFVYSWSAAMTRAGQRTLHK
jgi:hypothetical protein